MQEVTFELKEYNPAAHNEHDVAPAAVPVFVMDMAKHSAQPVSPAVPKYPGEQLAITGSLFVVHVTEVAFAMVPQVEQIATADVVEYLPVAHDEHVAAPAATPVSVMDMAAHCSHVV